MRIRKAVITAAGRNQRTLPLQTLIDRDGVEKSVLRIIIEEVQLARIDEICVVIPPGDLLAYQAAAADKSGLLQGAIRFIEQDNPRGYGFAVSLGRSFVADEPFLHLVGDHLYISASEEGCASQLVKAATQHECSISLVQPTRENAIQHYGAIGGQRVSGEQQLFRVETVLEKPTPTEAEQKLVVTGMRSGQYLCFFGMHVLTPIIFDILARTLAENPAASLSSALSELARNEQYLALDCQARRYDVGVKYGLLRAQLALALSGAERKEVLSQLLEVLAQRNLESA